MRRFFKIVIGLLRQLSDESAYERHLLAHGLQHSPQEWRRFSDHHLKAKYTRAKCC
ncbi:MAG: hypothetical protein JNL98_20095 [Bryobacterales bacterium]|nr:hypothetical protein [Bryobacterales bacterium]